MSSRYARLPEHVVCHIIELAAGSYLESKDTWYRALPLLAVCHTWRSIAAKVIHATVFCNSHASLLVATTGTHLVKCAHMSADSLSKFEALISAEHACTLATAHWPNVSELRITLHVDIFNRTSNGSLPALEHSKAMQLAAELATKVSRAMPRVTHLHLRVDLNLPAYCAFVHRLLPEYAAQLKSVVCRSMLFLDMPEDVLLLDPQKLSRLSLENLPTIFSLAQIAQLSSLDKLTFSALHTLRLHFRDLPVDAEKELSIDILESLLEQPADTAPSVVLPMLNTFELSSFSFATLCRLFGSREGYVWPNVQTLEISGSSELPRRSTISNHTHESMSHRLVSQIVRAMPCISTLRLSSESLGSSSAPAYYSHLVCALADQLVHIDVSTPVLLPFPRFSDQITYLRVRVNANIWQQFPRFSASALRYLHLENVPVGHFWSQIVDSPETGCVTFDCLESLVIKFEDVGISQSADCARFLDERINTRHFKVACPRLASVEITDGCLAAFQSILNGFSPTWPLVRRLILGFRSRDYGSGIWHDANGSDSDGDDGYPDANCKFMDALNLYSRTLAKQLPNVVHLQLAGSTLFNIHSHFFSALASVYASQLVHLECNIPISLTTHELSHYLRVLAISSNPTSALLLPKINPANLVTLYVKGASMDFMRYSFDSTDGNVGFDNLKSMQLSIHANSDSISGLDSNHMPPTIHAPILQHLSLEFCGDIHPWQAVFKLKNIASIDLAGAFSGIACVANDMEANCVDKLNIKINSFVDSDDETFYQATNHLLDNSDRFKSRSSALSLPPMPFALSTELIKWSGLTDLCLTKTDFVTVTKLLPCLSNLVKFTYNQIPTNYTPDLESLVIRDNAPMQSDNPQVLSNSIKTLNIMTFPRPQDFDSVIACCTYLLVLIPSLTTAEINGPRSWNLRGVVSRFTNMYPHIIRLGHRISNSG